MKKYIVISFDNEDNEETIHGTYDDKKSAIERLHEVIAGIPLLQVADYYERLDDKFYFTIDDYRFYVKVEEIDVDDRD